MENRKTITLVIVVFISFSLSAVIVSVFVNPAVFFSLFNLNSETSTINYITELWSNTN